MPEQAKGLSAWFRRQFRRARPADGARAWDGLTDTRLNAVQFESATGNSINSDLLAKGAILRKRCAFIARQPMVEDVIQTFIADCIGQEGPQLQCVTANPEYKAAFEAGWFDWWMNCDINGQLPGPDMMRCWLWSLFVNGNIVVQLAPVSQKDPKAVSLRLNNIDPARLETPSTQYNDDYTVLGIKRDVYGKPLSYYIRKADTNTLVRMEYDEIPAKDIIHFFDVREPGQAQGVPMLASVLGSIADLKQFDGYVLEAAKMSAMLGVLLEATNPGTQLQNVDTSTMADIEAGMIATIPPGYKPTQINPQQPAANYIEFRHDLQRDAGRPIGMPLMKVNKDASKHNYSSARYDDQQYNRRNATFEGGLSRRVMTPLAMAVKRYLELTGKIPVNTPADMYLNWVWPRPVHVDPKKEAEGQRLRIESNLSSYTAECAVNGVDFSEVVAQLGTDIKALKAAGIEIVPAKNEPEQKEPVDAKENGDDTDGE